MKIYNVMSKEWKLAEEMKRLGIEDSKLIDQVTDIAGEMFGEIEGRLRSLWDSDIKYYDYEVKDLMEQNKQLERELCNAQEEVSDLYYQIDELTYDE